MSMVIVIGPTPPGTGVIALAFSLMASKSVSPMRAKPLFLDASGTRFTPTSMTSSWFCRVIRGLHLLQRNRPARSHSRQTKRRAALPERGAIDLIGCRSSNLAMCRSVEPDDSSGHERGDAAGMPSSDATVGTLLRRWHAGDRDALERLIADHLPWLRNYVHARLGPALRARGETVG